MILLFWRFDDSYNITGINVNDASFCQLNRSRRLLQGRFPMACCCNPPHCRLARDLGLDLVVAGIHLRLRWLVGNLAKL